MESNMPDILYHYCSIETFHNIVSNRSIWLSDVSKSNDAQELLWFIKQCRNQIYKAWVEYAEQLKAENRLLEADFDGFQPIANQIDIFYEFPTVKCWAFCLSEKSDDLGQWRGYASDGFGIAIGFKTGFFASFNSPQKDDIAAYQQLFFDRIDYSPDSISSLLNDTCHLGGINTSLSSKEVLSRLRKAVAVLLLGAPLFKNEKFAEEKEWRIAVTLTLGQLRKGIHPKFDSGSLPPGVSIQYDYAINNGRLVSHIDVHDKGLSDHVAEIWLGPKCKETEHDMRLYLISKGWLRDSNDNSILIRRSEASYR